MYQKLLEWLDSACKHGDIEPVNFSFNNCKHCELIAQAADAIRELQKPSQDKAEAVSKAVETGYMAGYMAGYRDRICGNVCLYPPQLSKAAVLLSPNDLMDMKGQPVWLHTFSRKSKKTNIAQWAIVENVCSTDITFVRAGVNSRLNKLMSAWGDTWVAYRYPPEDYSEEV